MNRIYLDNAATTPIDDAVLDAILPFLKSEFGNASSTHSFGKPAKVLIEDARDTVAGFLGCAPKEIYFTSGGTESNNFALKGIALSHLAGSKKHIVSDAIEHSAVLDTLRYLESKFGFRVTYISPDKSGVISAEEVESNITDDTFLVSVMHSNNEIGTVNDIESICRICNERGVYIHTDSVQSIGKTDFDLRNLNVNLATLSAHKIYGPKGIAALYIRKGTPVEKFIHGGMQERDMRGGTENVAAVAGLKKAVEILSERMNADIAHYRNLKSRLLAKLRNNFGDRIFFNSSETDGLPNIVNVTPDEKSFGIDGEVLLIKLDLMGFAVSGGSACTSGAHKPSHVLKALGKSDKEALSSVRISFGRENTVEDAESFADALWDVVSGSET